MRQAIGIDIGGTKIEAAVIADDAAVTQIVRHKAPETASEMADLILNLTQDLLSQNPKILGVGFSIPGSLDPKTQVLRNAPNSPAINGTDFFARIAQKISIPCRFENDANCLILGETRFGAAKGFRNAVGIIMGTGFGSGVMHHGSLLVGHRGLAPELGHSILNVNGRPCLCGNRGCVEAYLSGPSIFKRYAEAGGTNCADTVAIFSSTDPLAQRIVTETLHLFDRFLAMVVSLYDPEVFVLGGGLSLQKNYYGRENESARFIFGSREPVPVRAAAFGDASGKLGAAALFFT